MPSNYIARPFVTNVAEAAAYTAVAVGSVAPSERATADHIALRSGDVVLVFAADGPDWLVGTIDGRRGLAPARHLAVVEPVRPAPLVLPSDRSEAAAALNGDMRRSSFLHASGGGPAAMAAVFEAAAAATDATSAGAPPSAPVGSAPKSPSRQAGLPRPRAPPPPGIGASLKASRAVPSPPHPRAMHPQWTARPAEDTLGALHEPTRRGGAPSLDTTTTTTTTTGPAGRGNRVRWASPLHPGILPPSPTAGAGSSRTSPLPPQTGPTSTEEAIQDYLGLLSRDAEAVAEAIEDDRLRAYEAMMMEGGSARRVEEIESGAREAYALLKSHQEQRLATFQRFLETEKLTATLLDEGPEAILALAAAAGDRHAAGGDGPDFRLPPRDHLARSNAPAVGGLPSVTSDLSPGSALSSTLPSPAETSSGSSSPQSLAPTLDRPSDRLTSQDLSALPDSAAGRIRNNPIPPAMDPWRHSYLGPASAPHERTLRMAATLSRSDVRPHAVRLARSQPPTGLSASRAAVQREPVSARQPPAGAASSAVGATSVANAHRPQPASSTGDGELRVPALNRNIHRGGLGGPAGAASFPHQGDGTVPPRRSLRSVHSGAAVAGSIPPPAQARTRPFDFGSSNGRDAGGAAAAAAEEAEREGAVMALRDHMYRQEMESVVAASDRSGFGDGDGGGGGGGGWWSDRGGPSTPDVLMSVGPQSSIDASSIRGSLYGGGSLHPGEISVLHGGSVAGTTSSADSDVGRNRRRDLDDRFLQGGSVRLGPGVDVDPLLSESLRVEVAAMEARLAALERGRIRGETMASSALPVRHGPGGRDGGIGRIRVGPPRVEPRQLDRRVSFQVPLGASVNGSGGSQASVSGSVGSASVTPITTVRVALPEAVLTVEDRSLGAWSVAELHAEALRRATVHGYSAVGPTLFYRGAPLNPTVRLGEVVPGNNALLVADVEVPPPRPSSDSSVARESVVLGRGAAVGSSDPMGATPMMGGGGGGGADEGGAGRRLNVSFLPTSALRAILETNTNTQVLENVSRELRARSARGEEVALSMVSDADPDTRRRRLADLRAQMDLLGSGGKQDNYYNRPY